MKHLLQRSSYFFLLMITLFSAASANALSFTDRGFIAVANRGDTSVSIIDVDRDKVIHEIMLPPGLNAAEPMYVVHTFIGDQLFVGDRSNDRVLVYNARDYSFIGEVAVGKGVFHMWSDPVGQQLWVVNDVDKTLSVISPKTLSVIATVPIADDIVAIGGKPHDVIVTPTADAAFVTMVGISTGFDLVVKYSTETFEEVARAEVGKDPHLSLTPTDDLLYVPTQNNNQVHFLNQSDLSEVKVLEVPGAHGAGMPIFGDSFYTTNLPNGGEDGVFVIDRETLTVKSKISTLFPVPHNIATTYDGKKLYVTHSGADATQVSVYGVLPFSKRLVLKRVIKTGANPFGITYIP